MQHTWDGKALEATVYSTVLKRWIFSLAESCRPSSQLLENICGCSFEYFMHQIWKKLKAITLNARCFIILPTIFCCLQVFLPVSMKKKKLVALSLCNRDACTTKNISAYLCQVEPEILTMQWRWILVSDKWHYRLLLLAKGGFFWAITVTYYTTETQITWHAPTTGEWIKHKESHDKASTAQRCTQRCKGAIIPCCMHRRKNGKANWGWACQPSAFFISEDFLGEMAMVIQDFARSPKLQVL